MKTAILSLGLLASLAMVSCNNSKPAPEANATVKTDSATAQQPAPKPAEEAPTYGYKVGDAAEDFKLKNTDGKMVSMADFKDAKGFVVVFTCNHCPYSIAYEDRLIALDKKYKTKGYPVIAINPNDPVINEDDSYDKMIVRAKEKGFTFPYLFDEGQKIFPKYGATKTPHCYIIQKENNALKVAYIGAFDDSEDATKVTAKYMEQALDALLANKAPEPNFTKAFGCSVKYDKEKMKL